MSAVHELRRESVHPTSPDELWAWHARPGALERLTPPWERVRVLRGGGVLADGARVELETRAGPLRQRWVAEHAHVEPGRAFEDFQVTGPFRSWVHRHSMESRPGGSALIDDVRYELPLGSLGDLLERPLVRPRLRRLFAYRHRVLASDLERHRNRKRGAPMNVVVSGSHGLVGESLVPFLTTGGHGVRRLVRREARGSDEIRWDPEGGDVERAALEGVDAVVHLAGEGIAAGRWTESKKRAIRESRVRGTRVLCEALAALEARPRVLVCASAIGFYGDRGDERLDEESDSGSMFLSEVCRAWEEATEPARAAGIRVVNARFGVILSPAGGALAKMLPPFKMGIGGKLGSGEQHVSWIALDDAVGAIHHALDREELSGPLNVVSPNPVTNAELTRTLGRVLSRPTALPMPAFAARLAFGEMADELLLASTRVEPRRLEESGFAFHYPELEGALRHLLGRES